MLSPADFILLPYTSDMTPAGIAYACQALPLPGSLNTTETYRCLRQMVAQQASELAFRRYLTTIQVPHHFSSDSLFARPGRVSAVIGGRYCHLYISSIFNREKIRRIHQDLSSLLVSPTLIQPTELFQDSRSETDLLVFSFVTGLVTPTRAEIIKATSAGKPIHLLYPLASAWSQPSHGRSLGRVVLKSESVGRLTVSLGGYNDSRRYLVSEVELPPLLRVQVQEDYFSLAFVHVSTIPNRRLGLHCTNLDKTLIILPHQWGNIWVYGMHIVLAGWMTRGEYRRKANPSPKERYISQPSGGAGKYLGVPVAQLHPLEELFSRALSWG